MIIYLLLFDLYLWWVCVIIFGCLCYIYIFSGYLVKICLNCCDFFSVGTWINLCRGSMYLVAVFLFLCTLNTNRYSKVHICVPESCYCIVLFKMILMNCFVQMSRCTYPFGVTLIICYFIEVLIMTQWKPLKALCCLESIPIVVMFNCFMLGKKWWWQIWMFLVVSFEVFV